MNTAPSLADDRVRFRVAFITTTKLVGLVWLVFAVARIFSLDIGGLGIAPRSFTGLIGIPLAPFIHLDLDHILGNTFSALVLGTAMFYLYPNAARTALPILYLGSGLGIWLIGSAFADKANVGVHIGASGVCYGVMFFLTTIGLLRRDRRAIGILLIVLFLFGSMVWGVLPTGPSISWEGHLAGAVLGIACAFVFRTSDAIEPIRRYDWETDEADDEVANDDAEVYIMDGNLNRRVQARVQSKSIKPRDDITYH